MKRVECQPNGRNTQAPKPIGQMRERDRENESTHLSLARDHLRVLPAVIIFHMDEERLRARNEENQTPSPETNGRSN